MGGWARTWIVATIVWGVVVALFVGVGADWDAPPRPGKPDPATVMVLVWIVPALALLVLGGLIGWAVRGFRGL